MASPNNKIVLITGANTGIGFQIVRALCSSNQAYSILVGGRSIAKAQDAIRAAEAELPASPTNLVPIQVDVEDDDSIQSAFDDVQTRFGRLDALINNAGALFDSQIAAGTLTAREAWTRSWNVNAAGAHIMTATFMPLLLQSSDPRLLFVTSGTATLEGIEKPTQAVNLHPPKGWPKQGFGIASYRSAKCGLNMVMREWNRMLKEDGVKVWAVSPGFLATRLGGDTETLRKMGAGDPTVAGPFVRSVLEGQRDADVGKVITRDGVQPW